ncbi:MAG: glycosyltransferase 87 family protein, partial [Candidatus Eremiobacteraeota bacterium]|nr:glycosyltransferase 87 family protein [Candidatus Eremiobacteraeota bacterium]
MRLGALGVAVVAILLALTVARPHATPGPEMRDFESYYAAGQAWSARANPYSVDIWQFEQRIPGVDKTRAEVLPFVGPPAFLPLWAFLARLPFGIAATLWGALLLAATAMFLIVTLSRAGVLSIGAIASGVAILLGFGPFTSDLALGQAALLSFAACIGATIMLDRSRVVTAIWIFFAALQPNIALVLFSQAGRRKAAVLFAAVFAVFCAVGIACIGFPGAVAYMRDLAAHGDAERFVLIQITPTAIAYGLGAAPTVARIVGLFAFVAGIIVWAYTMRKAHVSPVWKLAISCALLPFVAPFFHEHDFVVLLLPALFCLAFAEERMWTIGAVGTVLSAVDWLGLAQRPDGTLQTALLTLG